MFMEFSSFRVDTKKKRYTHLFLKAYERKQSNRERVYEMPYPLVLIAYQWKDKQNEGPPVFLNIGKCCTSTLKCAHWHICEMSSPPTMYNI